MCILVPPNRATCSAHLTVRIKCVEEYAPVNYGGAVLGYHVAEV